MENKESVFFNVKMPAVTEIQILNYAKLFGIKKENLIHDGKFFVPGHYLIGLFRNSDLLEKLCSLNFPIKNLVSFRGSNGGTMEKRIFIGQPFEINFLKLSRNKKGEYLFDVKILSGKIFILSGLFVFNGEEN